MVHRREIDGNEVVFGNQGALWGNAMTWWDHDTGSIWSQPLGEAIAGPLTGERLELLPSTLAEWTAWVDEHPHTLALDAPGGRSGFALRAMVLVVEIGDEAVGYPVRTARDAGVINDEVAGAPLAVVVGDGTWAVFSRLLDDRVVELELTEGGYLRDADSSTTWDPGRGLGVDGPLADQTLALLPAFTIFPADFRTFFPDGELWDP